MTESVAILFLNHLEALEAEHLVWGFVDGGFPLEELLIKATEFLTRQVSDLDAEDLIRDLLDQRLLFGVNAKKGDVYRTRFAESVRLFARLKQTLSEQDWPTAPRLVTDFRLGIQARKYPPRTIEIAQVKQQLEESWRPLTELEEGVLKSLLTLPSGEFQRLSQFQVSACLRMLRGQKGQTEGMIVGAGTGTGKTLAFYIPCFISLVSGMKRKPHTHTIAIYPRNELLADQFTECLRQTRKLRSLTHEKVGRPIRIGTYYGLTPQVASEDELGKKKWPKDTASQEYLCPFLRCPNPNCGKGRMAWKRGDLRAARKKLTCLDCGESVDGSEIVFTRADFQSRPDILFTTTEMMNRHLSNSQVNGIFGAFEPRETSPSFLLLDEAHIYSGIHGAQVAYLIRRWRHLIKGGVKFVGLSATMVDAPSFFGDLTGVAPTNVAYVQAGTDLEEEGREYQLVLRGDPASNAQLLSTTIQATMLLGRILDPLGTVQEATPFSPKTFAFTDDLDAVNRLFHNLKSAEGWIQRWGQDFALASLRRTSLPNADLRMLEGQNWEMCERIGYSLAKKERLQIGRTTSQDGGVDLAAKVVVATASLEVGFNDSLVGAVLQHKAPLDMASFLQRRGRAGRQRVTRPWTVVVLSDYGRDRIAYQGYEHLMNPVLARKTLPVANRYVLKMQAAFCLMEFVMVRLRERGAVAGSVWIDFSWPSTGNPSNRIQLEIELLEGLLSERSEQAKLRDFLRESLRIQESEAELLLWQPPRGLLTEVVPTITRRLKSNWRSLTGDSAVIGKELNVSTPLPEFIPANLFSDLKIPEVIIDLGDREERMPLIQAIRTFCPGRVSKRYALERASTAHWIELPNLNTGNTPMSLNSTAEELNFIGVFSASIDGQKRSVRCFRPLKIAPKQTPKDVAATSNSAPVWRSQIFANLVGNPLDGPKTGMLAGLIRKIEFFTHSMNSFVTVRRFSTGCAGSIRTTGNPVDYQLQFEAGDGEIGALGFEQECDGFRCEVELTDEHLTTVLSGSALKAARVAFFTHRIHADPTIGAKANFFARGWAIEVFLAVLVAFALAKDQSISSVLDDLSSKSDIGKFVDGCLTIIFQIGDPGPDDSDFDDDETSGHATVTGRLATRLQELFADKEVKERFLHHAKALWQVPDESWNAWLRNEIRATLAGAIKQACNIMIGDTQSGEILADIDAGPVEVGCQTYSPEDIWITESTIGGGGVIQELQRQVMADSRQFFLLIELALRPNERERVNSELSAVVEVLGRSDDLKESFADLRQCESSSRVQDLKKRLEKDLSGNGILCTREVLVSLNQRILRPGSSPESDEFLRQCLVAWNSAENRLGIEVDVRSICYYAAAQGPLSKALAGATSYSGESPDRQQRFSIAYGLIWPRGRVIRQKGLDLYNPFADSNRGDPIYLRPLKSPETPIDLGLDGWRERVLDQLVNRGSARIGIDRKHEATLRDALLDLIGTPIDAGHISVYCHVAALEREGEELVATLNLKEAWI